MKKKIATDQLHEKVYEFKTKYSQGFLKTEIKTLIKEFKGVTLKKMNEKLGGITVGSSPDGYLIYHCDVLTALHCILENRDMYQHEFD